MISLQYMYNVHTLTVSLNLARISMISAGKHCWGCQWREDQGRTFGLEWLGWQAVAWRDIGVSGVLGVSGVSGVSGVERRMGRRESVGLAGSKDIDRQVADQHWAAFPISWWSSTTRPPKGLRPSSLLFSYMGIFKEHAGEEAYSQGLHLYSTITEQLSPNRSACSTTRPPNWLQISSQLHISILKQRAFKGMNSQWSHVSQIWILPTQRSFP